MAVGTKAEILPKYEIIKFNLDMNLQTCLNASAGISVESAGTFIKGQTYWSPLTGKITGEVELSGFTILDVNYELHLFNRLDGPRMNIKITE